MISEENRSARRRPPDWVAVVQFLAMDFVYLAIVYGWTLYLYPLGRDFAALAHPSGLPWGVRALFGWEIGSFGQWVPGYHLVNLGLLYCCMIAIFFLTRLATRGPWWLGSLAAVLFMANPLKSESVLNLCGAVDLFPTLLALLSLWSYGACVRRPSVWRHFTALAWFSAAIIPFRANAGLAAAVLIYEYVIPPDRSKGGRWLRVPGVVALGVFAGVLHDVFRPIQTLHPGSMFAPLHLIFYPIGLLPETAARYHESPWLGWATAFVIMAVFFQIARKARSRAFVFGLLGAAAMRLFQGEAFVDPVHMIGGGSMAASIALFGVSMGALSQRIQSHPKWTKPIVVITTAVCLVFLGMQARVNWAWRHAGTMVQSFQSVAAMAAGEYPGAVLGVLPDYQYYRGAPLELSASIAQETLFSTRYPVTPLLKTHYEQARGSIVRLESYSAGEAVLEFTGQPLVNLFPYPYSFHAASSPGDAVLMEASRIGQDTIRVKITPKSGTFPARRIPFGAECGSSVPAR